jgi:hypothetical protein
MYFAPTPHHPPPPFTTVILFWNFYFWNSFWLLSLLSLNPYALRLITAVNLGPESLAVPTILIIIYMRDGGTLLDQVHGHRVQVLDSPPIVSLGLMF